MANLQQTTGNLGADPEIITFNNGGKVARFNIAENRRFTVDGQVTLRGVVNSKDEKRQIAEAAAKVAGAGKIDNQLEVKASAPVSTSPEN